MSAHPAVVKAQEIGRIAMENGWKGNLESNVCEPDEVLEMRTRITTLRVTRNDEVLILTWHNKAYKWGYYDIFGRTSPVPAVGEARKRLRGWPDIIDLFKYVKPEQRPQLSANYVKLPFCTEDPDSDIIASLVDRKVHWYNRIDGKIHNDVVMRSKKSRIQPINHRKLLHFISPVGFRSVFLDQILKVG